MGDLEERPQTEDGANISIKYVTKDRIFVGGIGKEKIKKTLFSLAAFKVIAACLIGAMIAGGSIHYYNYKNSGYAVKYQGRFLGYVKEKGAAVEALNTLKDNLKKYDQSIIISDELEFQKILVNVSKLQDGKSIVKPLETGMLGQYTSYAISLNGNEIAVLGSETEAKKVVEELRKHFEQEESKSGAQVLSVNIKDDIKVTNRIVNNSKLIDANTVLNKLLAGKGTTKKYEVIEGDSLWRIAANNDMKIDDITAVNPGMDPERLQVGQSINLSVSEPYINVETTIKAVFDENIPYETQYVNDGDLYKGQTRVVESGEYGINKVEKQITKLNGKEIASTILSAAITKNPVTRILARGTKELIGSGRFLWPVNGRITSPFGSRGGEFHKGLDIGAPIGTPIAAADSGTVIFSGRNYGYGKMIMIDHGNGYVTYYGHCSTLYVDEGQTVTKGQRIADVGMTGWTTGPHLHFEVRQYGSAQNPINYLK